MMDFKIYTDFSKLRGKTEEWNTLLSESVTNSPFLRFEFLLPWWETLGGGEWSTGQLHLVTADQDGQLVGIAPLFLTHNRDGQPALMLLGSIEISDYLDLVVRPKDLDAFVEGLLDALAADDSAAWSVLDLYNLLQESVTICALKKAAEKRNWVFSQQRLQPAPYIPLPGDFEAYLAGIDKKQRHEIRRKMRRAKAHEKPVRWYIVKDGDTLEAEIEAFLDLMSKDPQKAVFLTDVMRSHLKTSVRAAFEAGWLQLAFLEVDGVKAAASLNLDYDNRILAYNSGFDPEYLDLSVGWVLLGYILQWANEQGRSEFDFMRGDEQYKYRFGAIDRFVTRVSISR
ncbi:MAG: GNAT family N-acetyltransferase [Anaerolineales bacterium]|nr:GNAT family N-acetyltransferase [Anaerolineales bacterium]